MSNELKLKDLRPNVGFVLKEAAGYTWPFAVELADITMEDGLNLDWLRGELRFSRTVQGIWVSGSLAAETQAECARCLIDMALPLELPLEELFYFPRSLAPNPDDYVILETGEMDLVAPIQEQMLISIPIQALCKPDCQGLCSHCGQNLNDASCGCQEDDIDPRLAILRQLQEGE